MAIVAAAVVMRPATLRRLRNANALCAESRLETRTSR